MSEPTTTATTTTSTLPATAAQPALPADWAPLVERLRLAHLAGEGVDVDDVALGAPRLGAADALVIDAHNGLVDVDARLSLSLIARALRARGWALPLLRPLPAAPLWRLATRAPFVVDALVQRATLLSVDGDLVETPAAPRHAAGPSLLHTATAPAPMAVLVRARLRVVSAAHTTTWTERFDDAAALAARVRDLVDGARAVAACARGRTLVVLGGASLAPTGSAAGSTAPAPVHRVDDDGADEASDLRWTSARSLRPGDVFGIESALRAGRRVVSVPYLQRTAVLERARPPRALLDVKGATAALVDALASAPANAPRDGSHHTTTPTQTQESP
ncbi:MAG: hypothetical protein FJ137_07080 [Deltaproteobacteria bacterium]|nr:hypothetical protein [Deltaproteobacteria bacterium]